MLSSLDISSVSPYTVAPYEWVVATASFAVNPVAPHNGRIIDLDLAPRGRDALVRFDADVRLLRPRQGGNAAAPGGGAEPGPHRWRPFES